jgi:hypothetical protein
MEALQGQVQTVLVVVVLEVLVVVVSALLVETVVQEGLARLPVPKLFMLLVVQE